MTARSITPAGPLALGKHTARVRDYLEADLPQSTKRAYAAEWRSFERWCRDEGRVALPADVGTVLAYLTSMADAGRAMSTIVRARTVIAKAHQIKELPDPTRTYLVGALTRGIRKTIGTRPQRQAAPLLAYDLRKAVPMLSRGLDGLLHRSLLTLGWSGGFRRSEVVALDVKDVEHVRGGLVCHLRRSKGDRTGHGAFVRVPAGDHDETCPVACLDRWPEAAGSPPGPLYRTVRGKRYLRQTRVTAPVINTLVKRVAAMLGYDPADYSAHSLRAGLVTHAIEAGVSEADIMAVTRHKSREMLEVYIRKADSWDQHPAKGAL